MTDIEAKALAMVNEVFVESGGSPIDYAALFGKSDIVTFALCRAIEQHEAYKQKVSDALVDYFGEHLVAEDGGDTLASFVIFKPKPDPLVEVIAECDDGTWETKAEYANKFRAALEARGLEIREKGQWITS